MRDATVLGQPTAILNVETAVDLATNNRESGEWLVFAGTSLRLIGIDAVRSVRSANTD